MFFLGGYNSTGGIQISFQGVCNSTGGIQKSTGGIQKSIQLSFLGVCNSIGGIQKSSREFINPLEGLRFPSYGFIILFSLDI